jgi:hypothetical protein
MRENKMKYLEACLEQHLHFSPFLVSMAGLLAKESQTLLNKLSTLLAEKWENSFNICGYVRAQISIATVRATHLCLCSSAGKLNKSNEQPLFRGGRQAWTGAPPPIPPYLPLPSNIPHYDCKTTTLSSIPLHTITATQQGRQLAVVQTIFTHS